MADFDPFAGLDEFPTLQTERLVLRELGQDDLAPAHRMYSDPKVMRYVGRLPHASIEETQEHLRRDRDLFPSRQGISWALTRRDSDQFIGSCGPWRLVKPHYRAEVGYDLLPEYWGQGLMTEALRASLRFCFTRMGLNSVTAQIDPQNQPSRRVLERLGFRQDGLLRQDYYFGGRFLDTAIFTLLRSEFLPSSP